MSAVIKLDPKTFEEAVRATAAAQPDKVYVIPTEMDSDGYEHDGEPAYVEYDARDQLVGSCLLGCALLSLGVPAGRLNVKTMDFPALAALLHLGLPDDLVKWADRVQDEQDDFKPWGEAVRVADAYALAEGVIV